MSAPSIAVIIPYFQREPGILARALQSVQAQAGCSLPIHVVVVDDASPQPAAGEVEPVARAGLSIQVLVQANGGPGAARNTGLDHVPPGTRYVAFLDSDDEWSSDHLARAVQALDTGFDFYFADHHQLGQSVSAFKRTRRLNGGGGHPPLTGPGQPSDLFSFQGSLLRQIIVGNPVGTSTVVYRFEGFADRRFRVEFTNAGEDYLFWMELAQAGARPAFSDQSEAVYGKGVNVYAGSGWGTDAHLLRVHNEMKYRKLTGKLFELDALTRQHLRQAVGLLRQAFARDLLHRIAHRKPLPWRLLRAQLRLDPWAPWGLAQVAVQIVRRKSSSAG